MTSDQFCYWLQGMFEVGNPTALDEAQTAVIREHLQLVFTKVAQRSVPNTAPGIPRYLFPSPSLPTYPHHVFEITC